jgi:hypothetical protein
MMKPLGSHPFPPLHGQSSEEEQTHKVGTSPSRSHLTLDDHHMTLDVDGAL